jgi:hypothetical protein
MYSDYLLMLYKWQYIKYVMLDKSKLSKMV